MPCTTIYNSDKTIDSLDIIARIDELETERDTYDGERGEERDPWTAVYPEDAAELAALHKLATEAEGYAADWHHGEVLIRDDYFTDYTRELLEDCGTIPRDLPWWVEIDWEATARNVRVDYTAVDFDGVTYWIR
jgi:hypothetical protein